MILIAMLSIITIIIGIIVALAIAIGGAAFIFIFGDVIVCLVILGALISRLIKRRNK